MTSRQAEIVLAYQLAETHCLTRFEVRMKDGSATLLAYRHPYQHHLTLEIELDATGTRTASILSDGCKVTSGDFSEGQETVLALFLAGHANH